jgi:hypothetical protein
MESPVRLRIYNTAREFHELKPQIIPSEAKLQTARNNSQVSLQNLKTTFLAAASEVEDIQNLALFQIDVSSWPTVSVVYNKDEIRIDTFDINQKQAINFLKKLFGSCVDSTETHKFQFPCSQQITELFNQHQNYVDELELAELNHRKVCSVTGFTKVNEQLNLLCKVYEPDVGKTNLLKVVHQDSKELLTKIKAILWAVPEITVPFFTPLVNGVEMLQRWASRNTLVK